MQITLEELNVISRLPHYCPVCAYKEWGLEELVHMCWEYLDLLRIYTKPKVCTDSSNKSLLPRCEVCCSRMAPQLSTSVK